MRLNVGCGRAQFPTTEHNPVTSHHLYALRPTNGWRGLPAAFDPAAEWVNIDRAALPGVDEVIDLWTYPWLRSSTGQPFDENSAEEAFCSHIVEHIPHTAKYRPQASAVLRQIGDLDGWYAFFYELWRILKPGGLVHIIAPYARSKSALSDPSHTRYITTESFGYFQPNPDAPFDYEIPYEYKIPYGFQIQVGFTPEGQQIIERVGIGEASRENDAISEFYMCLEAVK